MTQRLFNLARMTVSSSGVGVITLNSAVSGFATFAQAGVPAAGTVSYAINDTNQSEIGVGIYSSGAGLTLGSTGGGATRTPIMNHTGTSSAINMSNAAQVFITPNVTDWPFLLDVAGTTAIYTSTASGATGAVAALSQNSTSPAINDYVGLFQFYGNNSALAQKQYGELNCKIFQTTAGAEYGTLSGQVMSNGTMSDALLGTETFLLGYQNPASNNFEYVFRAPSGKVGYMYMEGFDPGAVGPSYNLWHNSATPASNDVIGSLAYDGNDNAAAYTHYTHIDTVITDPVAATKSADIRIFTMGTAVSAERLRIGGVGSACAITTNGFASPAGDAVAVVADPTAQIPQGIYAIGANVSGPAIFFRKTRAASPATQTIINNGDSVGQLLFQGSDGAAYQYAAAIQCFINAAPGANDMPGRLTYLITPDGSATPVERFRMDSPTTAGQTAMMLWDVDNATLERVTVGAADTGGVGFKVLRIPN